MSDRPYQNKQWLYDKYYRKGMTTTEIAELPESCNRRTLNTWLNRNGIQRRLTPELPYESLVEQYQQGKSIYTIADEYGVSATTVSKRLKKLGVTPDNSGPQRKPPSHDFHDNGDKYIYERVSTSEKQVRIHQLVAIANGESAHTVFSPETHVHHKNKMTLDNRPRNLEVLTASEHMRTHNGGE